MCPRRTRALAATAPPAPPAALQLTAAKRLPLVAAVTPQQPAAAQAPALQQESAAPAQALKRDPTWMTPARRRSQQTKIS